MPPARDNPHAATSKPELESDTSPCPEISPAHLEIEELGQPQWRNKQLKSVRTFAKVLASQADHMP